MRVIQGSIFTILGLFACLEICAASPPDRPTDAEKTEMAKRMALESIIPDGLSLKVRFKAGKSQFHMGELITVEFEITAPPEASLYYFSTLRSHDEHGSDEQFDLAPHDHLIDPGSEINSGPWSFMGGPPHTAKLGTALKYEMDLNEWLRVDKPGHYQMTAITRRVFGQSHEAAKSSKIKCDETTFFKLTEGCSRFRLVAEALELEILPHDPVWEAETLALALKQLPTPEGAAVLNEKWISQPSYERGPEACHTIRFLGSEAAALVLIQQRLQSSVCGRESHYGIYGSPHRSLIIDELAKHLENPESGINEAFIGDLEKLTIGLEFPTASPSNQKEYESDRRKWFQTMEERRDMIRGRYLARLSQSVFHKDETARMLSLKTLVVNIPAVTWQRWPSLFPAWVEQARPIFAAHFLELPVWAQEKLLIEQWASIASLAMIGPLKAIIANPPEPDHHYPMVLEAVALDDLLQLEAGEARKVILSEIRKPESRIGTDVLSKIPDRTLPGFDEYLLVQLNSGEEAISQADYTGSRQTDLLARFASPAIAPGVKKFISEYEHDHGDCSWGFPALLAYLFRVDPPFAASKLRAILKRYETDTSDCSVRAELFKRIARSHYSPEIEAVAIEALDHPDLEVAGEAALVLSRTGSLRVKALLWRRLEKLENRYSLTPEDKLALYGRETITYTPPVKLQEDLIRALTESPAWVLSLKQLEKLKTMLMLPYKIKIVYSLIFAMQEPQKITRSMPSSYCVNIGGCYNSVEDLKLRLSQFPRGTAFHLSSSFEKMAVVVKEKHEIMDFLKLKGMQLIN